MYKCAACGNVFEEGWSDEEAEAEMRANFGEDTTKEDCVVICDDCYQEKVKQARIELKNRKYRIILEIFGGISG